MYNYPSRAGLPVRIQDKIYYLNILIKRRKENENSGGKGMRGVAPHPNVEIKMNGDGGGLVPPPGIKFEVTGGAGGTPLLEIEVNGAERRLISPFQVGEVIEDGGGVLG